MSISRRRVLASAVTGATLLMVPREVLGTTGPAAASSTSTQAGSGVSGVSEAVSPEVTPTPDTSPSSSQTQTPETVETAGADAITAGPRYEVVVESITYRGQVGTVYRPQVTAAHPVVYFLHGGFWEYGSRHQYDREAQIWAERGWVAVTLDYSLGAGAGYRTMVDDVWAGVSLMDDQWYADSKRQILFGDSAGGHLAAMVAVEHPKNFRGQILWSPVISTLNAYRDGIGTFAARYRLSRSAKRISGGDWRGSDPSTQVTEHTPPMWIAGSAQEFVAFDRQGQLMVDALERAGAQKSDIHLIKGDRHGKSLEQGPLLRSARAWARDQIQ